jgi:hypothetical protein
MTLRLDRLRRPFAPAANDEAQEAPRLLCHLEASIVISVIFVT